MFIRRFANNIEREIFRGGMVRWARVLNPIGWAFAFLGLCAPLVPDLQHVALAITSFACAAAVGISLWSGGFVRLDYEGMFQADTQRDGRPSIAGLFWPAVVVAGLRALDIDYVDATPFLIALVIGVGFAVAVAIADSKLAHREWAMTVVCAALIVWLYAALTAANVALDLAKPNVVSAEIVDMRMTTGRGRSYYLALGEPVASRFGNEIAVTHSIYTAAKIGDAICLLERPGSLGYAWFAVAQCNAPVAP